MSAAAAGEARGAIVALPALSSDITSPGTQRLPPRRRLEAKARRMSKYRSPGAASSRNKPRCSATSLTNSTKIIGAPAHPFLARSPGRIRPLPNAAAAKPRKTGHCPPSGATGNSPAFAVRAGSLRPASGTTAMPGRGAASQFTHTRRRHPPAIARICGPRGARDVRSCVRHIHRRSWSCPSHTRRQLALSCRPAEQAAQASCLAPTLQSTRRTPQQQ